MDIIADDETGLKKQKKITWDSKTHRFKKEQIGSDNKKRIKTESGTLVSASFKTDRYEKWQKKTRGEIQRVGEIENKETSELNQNGKRYRYTGITAPKFDSKTFQRKLCRMEGKLRKEGLSGKDLKEQKEKWIEEKKKLVSTVNSTAKSELKSVKQIAVERQALDKRREKTGRHAHIVKKGGIKTRGSKISKKR
jgi:ATP-dependent RNA helicase DDX54/DBP10